MKVINLETNEEITFELPEDTVVLTYQTLRELREYLEENSGKYKVEIPEDVTNIGYCAFAFCTSLTTINLPGSFTSIGNSAFRGCSSLKTINIPQNVTSIGDGTFSGCTSLETINLPDSVTSIGSYAFSDCTSLARINICDPNKNMFHGQSLLHFALEESNSILAINTLLDHGNNIKCQSLPVNLKNHLFPKSKPDDEIDSDKVLKHLLSNNHFLDKLGKQCCQSKNSHILDSLIDSNNSEVLLALLSSHNKIAIDNLVQRYINTGKLQVLHKLIEDNKNGGEESKDLSLLNKTIAQRTQSIFFGEKVWIPPGGKIQSFLGPRDLTSFLLTCQGNSKGTQSFSQEMSSSSSSPSGPQFS